MNQQITGRNFANTPVRRCNRVKSKTSVDYQIPDESDVHRKPAQGKSTEVVLFEARSKTKHAKNKTGKRIIDSDSVVNNLKSPISEVDPFDVSILRKYQQGDAEISVIYETLLGQIGLITKQISGTK